MAKMKINIFFVNAEFYRVVWTINALLTVRWKMRTFSGNIEKNQNVRSHPPPPPPPPPEYFAIMYIMIICHWAILHYNMSFKTIAGRSDGVFWWFPALSEDQEEKNGWIHQNYLVALKVQHDTFANAPDLHEISSADGFWYYNDTLKVLELNAFKLRDKKWKCNPDFLCCCCLFARVFQTLLEVNTV